jgi:hypothetical protein
VKKVEIDKNAIKFGPEVESDIKVLRGRADVVAAAGRRCETR